MMCMKCGGILHPNETCQDCGADYKEQIQSVRHDEMRKLFLKIEKTEKANEYSEVEESLMAAEVANSHLLVAVDFVGRRMMVKSFRDGDGKIYILLFTDLEEYEKMNYDVPAQAMPISLLAPLLGKKYAGFIVNVKSEAVFLTRKFVEKYFGEMM